jgi:hypothetical protein
MNMPANPSSFGEEDVAWHISTRSDNGGASCVEAGPLMDGSGRVAVRHSHSPDGPRIVFTSTEWRAFIEGARIGEFDFDIL